MDITPEERLKIEMMERELHGLDVELGVKRSQHRALTTEIETLEKQRANLQLDICRKLGSPEAWTL